MYSAEQQQKEFPCYVLNEVGQNEYTKIVEAIFQLTIEDFLFSIQYCD